MTEILLADDHLMFREGLKQILAKYDYLTIKDEAGTTDEVLERLKENKYDLILLDISMPGISVFDLIKEIKKYNDKQPILILSMHPEEQFAIRLMNIGADGYVSKDSAAEELVSAINIIMSGKKYASENLKEIIAESVFNPKDSAAHKVLSNREFEVMCYIGQGKSLKEIGDILFISEKTVSTYRARVLEKLNLKNNNELIKYVLVNKLIN